VQNDYYAWRAHFGEAVTAGRVASSHESSTGVPEPGAFLVSLSGIVCLAARCRRPRRVADLYQNMVQLYSI
jgi:hypothetical protein